MKFSIAYRQKLVRQWRGEFRYSHFAPYCGGDSWMVEILWFRFLLWRRAAA